LWLKGYKRFEGGALATFNKKIANLKSGLPAMVDENEVDEITPANFELSSLDDDNEQHSNSKLEESALHDETD